MITQTYIDQLTYKIIGCAIEVHKVLGLGLLESIYEKCLIHEFYLISIARICFTKGKKTFVNEYYARLPLK